MNYAPRKALVGALITGACTFLICIPFFILLVHGEMPLSSVAMDLLPGMFITPFICSLIQIPLKKKSTKAGKEVIVSDMKNQAAYLFLPTGNAVVFCIAISLVTMVLFTFLPFGIVSALAPELVFTRWGYIFFKSACSGIGAAYAIYHVGIVLPYILSQK